MQKHITTDILYVGVNDVDIDLFESQYPVPNGISYNSYIIIDEKVAIMDTVDTRKQDQWFEQLQSALNGKWPDYLVVTHMEPDHTGGIKLLTDHYPEMQIVGNAKTFTILKQFVHDINDLEERQHIVKEADTLSLGRHTLQFITAPMVHWPEVMVAYETHTKTLFSADAFGKFGVDIEDDWTDEARRYYYNIVGKYGANVQSLLKKVINTEINTIAPLHGPVLRENIGYHIDLYNKWSRYEVEEDSILICYASIHGHTAFVAKELKRILAAKGKTNVDICDLAREDMAEAIEEAFYSETLVLAASTYDGGVFPPMEHYLHHLKSKNFQNRRVAIIENGSWGPVAAKTMLKTIETMKQITLVEPIVTIRSAYKPEDVEPLETLADALIK